MTRKSPTIFNVRAIFPRGCRQIGSSCLKQEESWLQPARFPPSRERRSGALGSLKLQFDDSPYGRDTQPGRGGLGLPVIGHYHHQQGEAYEEDGAGGEDAATAHALASASPLHQPDHSHDHQGYEADHQQQYQQLGQFERANFHGGILSWRRGAGRWRRGWGRAFTSQIQAAGGTSLVGSSHVILRLAKGLKSLSSGRLRAGKLVPGMDLRCFGFAQHDIQ